MNATRARFPDGRRHLQHGPIDLIVEAEGDRAVVEGAHEAAWLRFTTILDELVMELPLLKRPLRKEAQGPAGAVARRMATACMPHSDRYITPMAAVAGAVADELIECYRRDGIRRAWVNNGGDIALHLAAGEIARIGLFADLARFDPRHASAIDGRFAVTHDSPVRGIATSGWRGRSFSLGIADSVTVLARCAADADAAATMIANAVDVDDPRIVRRPASTRKDDSDLGDLLVTVDVPPLRADLVREALRAGLRCAEALRDGGLIDACALVCQGTLATTGSAAEWHAPRFVAPMPEAA